MKTLIPLIDLIYSTLENPEEIDNLSLTPKGKKLFKLVVDGSVQSDWAAAKKLYGTISDDRAYVVFKYRFKKDIIKCVSKLEFAKGNSLQQTYVHITDLCCAAKKLIAMGKSREAMDIMKPAYKIAKKYKFHPEACFMSRNMAHFYRVFYRDEKRSDELYRQNKILLEIIAHEVKSEKFYSHIIHEYIKSPKGNEKLAERAKDYYLELEKEAVDSHIYMKYYYIIKIIHFDLLKDHENALRYLREAISYFQSLAYEQNSTIDIFRRKEMNILINCHEYEKAKKILLLTQKRDDYSFAYFKNKELEFLLELRLKDYYRADEICQEVLNDARLKYEEDVIKDKWALFSLYMNVLIPERDDRKIPTQLRNFRSDKKGVNVLILICELLYHHFRGDTEFIYNRTRMLKEYIRKHLDKKEDRRTILFLNMIFKLPKRNFTSKFITDTDRLLAELKEIPTNINDLEPIPYDEMWDWLTRERRQKMAS